MKLKKFNPVDLVKKKGALTGLCTCQIPFFDVLTNGVHGKKQITIVDKMRGTKGKLGDDRK